jgi:hypothetical protein
MEERPAGPSASTDYRSGGSTAVGGFRYTPRQGDANVGGRIKAYNVYVGDTLAK